MVSQDKGHRIRDIQENVAWKDVPTHLEKRRQRVLGLMQRIEAEKQRTDENMLYFQCLAKACELVELFSKAWGTQLPLGCLATRSLLELNLLVRLFEQEPTSRLKFWHSALWEEKEELEAYLAVDPSSDSADTLRQRLRQLNEIEKRYGLSRDNDYIRLRWNRLAQRFNVKTDYETIYRWSSKMLHITPYSIHGAGRPVAKSEEEANWNLLLTMTQLYLGDLFQRLSGLLGLEIGN